MCDILIGPTVYWFLTAFVLRMGSAWPLVQEAATLVGAQVFWRQDRSVLYLAGFLHYNADPRFCGWVILLSVRHLVHGLPG